MLYLSFLSSLGLLASAAGRGINAVGESMGRLSGPQVSFHNHTNYGAPMDGLSANQFHIKNGISPGEITSPKLANDLAIKLLVGGQWSYF